MRSKYFSLGWKIVISEMDFHLEFTEFYKILYSLINSQLYTVKTALV